MTVSTSSQYRAPSVGESSISSSSSSSDWFFVFRQSKEELINALRSMRNPFVARAVAEKFKNLAENPFDRTEEFANSSFFEGLYLPREIKELIERLSRGACKCLDGLDLPEKIKEVGRAFREIGEVVNSAPLWDDLAILLKQPEIQALSLRDLDLIMGNIEGGVRLTDVISIVQGTLDPDDFNRFCKRIEEEEGDDLPTLIDEIRRNKPVEKAVNDIFSLWNEDETYFKSRTLKLDVANILIQEPVVNCQKGENGWHFQCDDAGKTSIRVREDRSVEICQNHCYKLVRYLTSPLMDPRAEVFLQHGEKGLSELPEGRYVLSVTQRPEGKNCLEVYLCASDSSGKKEYLLLCTKNPERGDITEVILKQGGRESKIPLDLFYQIQLKKETKQTARLNDPARQLAFDEPRPENGERVKLFQMRTIQEELKDLERQLLNNPALLNQLLDEYCNSRCQTIDPQSIPEKWRKVLDDISYRYRNHLNVERPLSTLVVDLVNAANYARFVPGNQSIQVRHMMELLQESQKYTRELKGKDVTLFIGNTGAGKSTAIAYLLGAPLKPHENFGGESCFILEGESKRYPKIGQGLGTSQTVFAQGFPIEEGSETVLCDPPGFNDTRGEEHVLCANLTLDQAVKQSRSIRAVVLTIPVQAFQVDRGGPVISLVERVRERFPDILGPKDTHKVPQYVILTKSGQVQSGVVNALEEGRRFQALRDEVDQEVRKESEKEEPNMPRIDDLKRQKEIWQAFLNLHDHEMIDIPNLQNRRRRQLLLKKYTDSKRRVDVEKYVSAVDTPKMKKQCEETFELSAASWRSQIFEKYLNTLPETIDRHETNIARVKGEISRYEVELKDVTDEIENLKQKKRELEQIDTSARNISNQEIQGQLVLLKNHRLEGLDRDIQRNNQKVESLRESVCQLDKNVAIQSDLVMRHESQVTGVKDEIEQLVKTPHKDILYDMDSRRYSTWEASKYKSGAWEQLIADPDIEEADCITGETTSMNLDTRKGLGEGFFRISNDYRIVVKKGEKNINLKKRQGGEDLQAEANGYLQAEANGAYYQVYKGGVNAAGTRVSYGYRFHWQGSAVKRPWIEVFHIVPGYEHNRASIQILNSKISALEKEIVTARAEMAKFRGEIDAYNWEIQCLQEVIEREKGEAKDLSNQMLEDQDKLIKGMIVGQSQAIAEKEQRKHRLSERIAQFSRDIAELQDLRSAARKEKKHLATLIYSEWETAKVLRDLIEMIMNPGNEGEQVLQKTSLEECGRFVEFYDKKASEVREKVHQELEIVA